MLQWSDEKHGLLRENNEDFESSTKCWSFDNDYVDNEFKVRDHCHINGRYRGSAQKYQRHIDIKLDQKIPIVFHNLNKYDSHLIIQELGKLNLKINGLEKYMSFSINNKLSFYWQLSVSKFFIR